MAVEVEVEVEVEVGQLVMLLDMEVVVGKEVVLDMGKVESMGLDTVVEVVVLLDMVQEEQVEVGMAVVKELEEVLVVMGVDTEEAVGVERVVAMVATPLKISSLYQMRLLL